MNKLILYASVSIACITSFIAFFVMVIFGNTITRILSFLPCLIFCAVTYLLIILITFRGEDNEKDD